MKTHTENEPRFLTVEEAAARLRIHPMTLRQKIWRSEIPAVQLGGKGRAIRIDERELDAWLYLDDNEGDAG